jgi:hypothetical protein
MRIVMTTGDVYAPLYNLQQPEGLSFGMLLYVKVAGATYRVTYTDKNGLTAVAEQNETSAYPAVFQTLGGVVSFDDALFTTLDLSPLDAVKGVLIEVKSTVPGSPANLEAIVASKIDIRYH